MRNILFIFALIVLTNCGAGNTGRTSGGLGYGQYHEPQTVGKNSFLIVGYSSQDAINGAKEFCGRTSKSFEMEDLTLAGGGRASRMVFSCY